TTDLIAYLRWWMSTTSPGSPLPAVVLGGGLAGLAAARLLRRHFPRVVVLERDRRPETAAPEDAFAAWERRGVPQFRHSHAFLARLRVMLLAHLPDVLDRLRAVGVREFGLDEVTPPGVTLAPRADDEDVVLLACRRSTFEWALRASVAGRPGIELREGVVIEGLVGEARDGGRPTVTGVRLTDGSTIPAAIVVDATGASRRASRASCTPAGRSPRGARAAARCRSRARTRPSSSWGSSATVSGASSIGAGSRSRPASSRSATPPTTRTRSTDAARPRPW